MAWSSKLVIVFKKCNKIYANKIDDVIKSDFGTPRNQLKLIFSEKSSLEIFEDTFFIDFGQVFQKLCQCK